MLIDDRILQNTHPAEAGIFRRWQQYLYHDVDFNMPDSEIHSYAHTERVLLHALTLGYEIMKDDPEALDILAHAALFHDTRRQDDYLDTGHGARGAVAYEQHCASHPAITFHPESTFLMRYHDLDDTKGIESIRKHFGREADRVIRLYSIFKDADALDRWRLGSIGLDPAFLRNEAAKKRVDYARQLVGATTDPERLDYIDRLVKSTMSDRMLLIIDPQVDFISGSLPVPGAIEAMADLAKYVKANGGKYKVKVVTADYHPADHMSFVGNGGQWPVHCVAGTPGAEIAPAVYDALQATPGETYVFFKGQSRECEQYSIFDNPEAAESITHIAADAHIRHIDICGLAGDVCVLASLQGAMQLMPDVSYRVLTAFSPSIDGGTKLADFTTEHSIPCDR
ncbi:MAG: isochorismatase family protein [Paramuribaculum sp.]|nr:isochorismatase family protein [Paramuribaculum sp.]